MVGRCCTQRYSEYEWSIACWHRSRQARGSTLYLKLRAGVTCFKSNQGKLISKEINETFSKIIAGISLTITIALFHGKCHLLHRRQFLQGYVTPFNKIVDDNRHYYFGWSVPSIIFFWKEKRKRTNITYDSTIQMIEFKTDSFSY